MIADSVTHNDTAGIVVAAILTLPALLAAIQGFKTKRAVGKPNGSGPLTGQVSRLSRDVAEVRDLIHRLHPDAPLDDTDGS